MKDLVTRVELWAEEKGLLSADPIAQFFKVLEESNEIIDAYNKRNIDNLKDGIGITLVWFSLVSIANHFGTTIEECLQIAYDEIKNRKGKMIGDTFVKEEDLNVK